jgi:chromosome segregation ATPase
MAALEAEHALLVERTKNQSDGEAERTQIAELKRQLGDRERWIQELETRLTIADARADEASAELEEQRERASRVPEPRSGRIESTTDSPRHTEAMKNELAALRRELDSVIAERDTMRRERAEISTARDSLQGELDIKRREASDLHQTIADRDSRIASMSEREDSSELEALEAQLRERGLAVRKLEADLREAERLGRELVVELETLREAPGAGSNGLPPNGLQEKLDRLAELNAQREADLAAARWSIEAMEARLVDSEGSDERQELERALDQARARLQEQAVLIEQLRSVPRD